MVGSAFTRRIAAIGLTALAIAAVGAVVIYRQAQAAPDPQGFLAAVDRNATGWSASNQPGRPHRDHLWTHAHSAGVVAEGQRACDWLAAHPDAPHPDPSGRSQPDQLAMAYARAHHDVPLAVTTRWGIDDAAFVYLCPGVRRDKTAPPHRTIHD